MSELSAENLLMLWERGRHCASVDQALLILTLAHPERTREDWVHLPLGQRDTALATVRQSWFGDEMIAFENCPNCSEALEVNLSCLAMFPAIADSANETCHHSDHWFQSDIDGQEVQYRLPNSLDVISVAMENDPVSARNLLLSRCVKIGGDSDIAKFANVEKIGEELLAQDPAAEIHLELTCAGCSEIWWSPFDIATFLFAEISNRAMQIAKEVGCLAKNFGWRELDILAMLPERRQTYLQMVLE